MKYKDFISKQNYRKFKRNLDYEEWLIKFISPPSDKELNQMENDNSVNNISYNPIQGAQMNIPPSVILTIVIATATIIKESLDNQEQLF